MWRGCGKWPACPISGKWVRNIIAALSRPCGNIWGRASASFRTAFTQMSWHGWIIFKATSTRCPPESQRCGHGPISRTGTIGWPTPRRWPNARGRWKKNYRTHCTMRCVSGLSTNAHRCCCAKVLAMLGCYPLKSSRIIAFLSMARTLGLYKDLPFGLTRRQKRVTVNYYWLPQNDIWQRI